MAELEMSAAYTYQFGRLTSPHPHHRPRFKHSRPNLQHFRRVRVVNGPGSLANRAFMENREINSKRLPTLFYVAQADNAWV